MLLLDLSPEPVGIGLAGLVLLVIAVVIISVPLLFGFVLLLKIVKRRRTGGDKPQPSIPNQ